MSLNVDLFITPTHLEEWEVRVVEEWVISNMLWLCSFFACFVGCEKMLSPAHLRKE